MARRIEVEITGAPRREFRSAELVDIDLQGANFRGYAAVFDSAWNDNLTEAAGYVETVARGAFRKAIGASGNIPLLWQHEGRDMLATTEGGTLKLKEDGKGLLVEAELPKSHLGEYVREMIERGDVRGMSYGMATLPEDSIVTKQDGVYHRSIANVRRLLDTTLTWEPAYPGTSAELRSAGFSVLPLQEILDGSEEQIEAAAAEVSSLEALRRTTELRISILEKGGIL